MSVVDSKDYISPATEHLQAEIDEMLKECNGKSLMSTDTLSDWLLDFRTQIAKEIRELEEALY